MAFIEHNITTIAESPNACRLGQEGCIILALNSDFHMLGIGAVALIEHEVEAVEIIIRLHKASQGVSHGINTVAGFTYAPAQLLAFVSMVISASIGLLQTGTLHIPVAFHLIHGPGFIAHAQFAHLHAIHIIHLDEGFSSLIFIDFHSAGFHHTGIAVVVDQHLDIEIHKAMLGTRRSKRNEGQDKQQAISQSCIHTQYFIDLIMQ